MKKILASILALAMIFMFVSCDSVAGPGEIISEDPFKDVTKLIGMSGIEYVVDSDAKTITEYYYGLPYQEAIYSIKVEGEKQFLCLSLSAGYDEKGTKYSLDEYIDLKFKACIEDYAEDIQEFIAAVKAGNEESMEKAEELLQEIKAVIDFDIEEITAENIETIMDKAMELLEVEYKEYLKELYSIVLIYELNSLTPTNKPGVYKIDAAFPYDDSEEWYNQINGYFMGETIYEDDDRYCEVSLSINLYETNIYIFSDEMWGGGKITEITDSKIIFEMEDENYEPQEYELSYTKTGTGKDTIITVQFEDLEIELKWEPDRL